ncbi:MAG TPA: oligosaccharide repeat unit polymerase [Chitinophagaceae bacterium]|nr:oligosaccharide repeat unit polymerase [Chitinophagaceae bacterium]
MDRNYTYLILAFNAAAAIYFFIKKKSEVPLFLVLFNIFVEYRLVSLRAGYTDWVSFEYVIPFKWNFNIAYKVSDLILLGNSIMIYCFMYFFKPPVKINDSNNLLYAFVRSKKKHIIYGLVIFTVSSFVLKGSNSAYAGLTKLGTTSFIIFFFLLIVADKKSKKKDTSFSIFIFLFLAYITYDTAMRFQFLGWMIPIGYYLTRDIKPSKKVVFSLAGIFVIMVVFSAAGVLRYKKLSEISIGSLYKESLERLKISDDINFIDGFMMIYQVYPEELPYEYGQEHLNILLRPIPRSLWPGKPLASWVRNVEARHGWVNEDSAGFSPTIWGVFYAEGGVPGVIFFSILWSWLLAYLYRSFSYFSSDLSAFLIGIILVCMIPIFRSGDMAGDFAIVIMSFWPMIIFTYQYKKFVKKQLQDA